MKSGIMLNHLKTNIMNTIIFISIMYYIISGLICCGRCMGESYKWYDKLISFIFGFVLTPLLVGKYIQIHM